MKKEALKLADDLDKRNIVWCFDFVVEASAMIRKLVEELDKQNQELLRKSEAICDCLKEIQRLVDKQGEPVAWRVAYREVPDSKIEYALDCASDGKEYLLDRVRHCDLAWIGTPEPLYTTPQTKDKK